MCARRAQLAWGGSALAFPATACLLLPRWLTPQADETIRELRAENEKLKYRVLHLVRNAREAEAERPPPPLPPLKRFSTDPFNYASPLSA